MSGVATACAILLAVLVGTGAVDRTLTPEATGKVIVDAVVDRIRSNCIFGNDRLFLRRLAYVESSDGEDPKTYRPDYHGGIWQIDEDKFQQITCSNPLISSTCDLIKATFNITWSSVVWNDLRTPLLSGLAAALYIRGKTRTPPIDVSSQAEFWVNDMRLGGNGLYFRNRAQQITGINCKTQLDLAFLLDGSGSVNWYDFQHMLRFIQTVVDKLEVNEEEVHVSVLEYSTFIGQTITFNDFTSKANLTRSIGYINKGNRGTNTHHAIHHATTVLFNTTTGARPGAKRVAILLTDGASNYFDLTVKAAAEAKAKGITMVTVGVGNARLLEIESVATAPNCTHSYVLNGFSEVDSLLYQLKDRSCSASTSLSAVGEKRKTTRKIPENATVTETFDVKLPKQEETGNGNEATPDSSDVQPVVKTEVQCGSLEIFASYNTPRPGPAFYDIHDSARDNNPSIIYLNSTLKGKPLYITVVATSDSVMSDVTSCLMASYNISFTTVPKKAEVVCRVGETVRMCTKDDFRSSEYSYLQCKDEEQINNPCAAGQVSVHEHPSDMTKFIRCDVTGKMYITQCPDDETFNINTESCGNEAIGAGDGTPLPSTFTSECTSENLAKRKFHFKHPGDKSNYIQCDAFGRAWVKPCPSGLHWSEGDNTCSHPGTSNPCQGAKDGTTFAHAQSGMYILCSHGKQHVMSCPPGLVFDSAIKGCNYPSV